MGSSERLTSPNATSVLFSNAVVTAFHAGARFRHQPHPSDAIQRTKRFFFTPDAISHVTLTSLPSLEWPRGGSTGRAISSSAGGRCSEGPCERGAGASEEGVERGACGGIRSAAGRCAVSLPLRDTTTLRHHPYASAALRPLPAPLSQPLQAGGTPRWCMVRWAVQRSAHDGAAVGAVAERRVVFANGLGPRRAGKREGENGAKHVMPARGGRAVSRKQCCKAGQAAIL